MAYDVISSYRMYGVRIFEIWSRCSQPIFQESILVFKTEQFTRFVDQLTDYQKSPDIIRRSGYTCRKTDAMMSMNIQGVLMQKP